MKQISIEQINAVLRVIYQTNISVHNFDAIKKMFTELPDVKEEASSKTATQVMMEDKKVAVDPKVAVDLEKLDKEIKDEENQE
jgi:hypothetical protein